MRKSPQIPVTCLGQLPPPTQEREAENVSSDVEVGSLDKHTEQLRGKGSWVPLSPHHQPPCALAPFSTSFFQHILAGEIGSCLNGSSITQLCLHAHCFSTGWAQQREGKKPQIPPKSASSTFSLTTIPLFAKHPAGAAASHQPVSLYCFSREKYMGLKKKKNHLLQTCCRTSSKQFAGAWQLP